MPTDSPSTTHGTARRRPDPPQFECGWRRVGPGTVAVHPVGELDLATVGEFREALAGAQSSASIVSIDLRQLAFIDCAGLAALVLARAFASRQGRRLVLVRGSGQVDRVLGLTGLLDCLEVREAAEPPIRGAAPVVAGAEREVPGA